ncbi:MAG: hypothetical protein ACRELD_01745 [Longimicrobiales bacterium]
MKNPFTSNSLSEPARRRVELAIALAQERLLNTHVEHALQLIEHAGAKIPFDSALDIYTRLLRLNADETRIVTTQALARLGERSGGTERWTSSLPARSDTQSERDRRSFMESLRQRMRGRVDDDMRREIELQAARAEVAVLETHVDNALHFVDILEQEIAFTEAVELYLEALEVRDSIAEVVYYFSLARLSDAHLPTRASGPGVRNAPAAESPSTPAAGPRS